MSRVKLDRARQFGTVHGPSSQHAYEQDGKQFDHAGNEYIDPAAPVPEPEADPFGLKEPEPDYSINDDDERPEDDLEALKMKPLRAVYFDLTQKPVQVGVNAEQLRGMIRAIRVATAQGLDFKDPAAG